MSELWSSGVVHMCAICDPYPFLHPSTHFLSVVRHPAKMFITRRLTRDRRKVYRTIRRKLGNDNYRRDLIEVGKGVGVCGALGYLGWVEHQL